MKIKDKFKNQMMVMMSETTCDIDVDSKKTGVRRVNGIAGRFFNRLFDFMKRRY